MKKLIDKIEAKLEDIESNDINDLHEQTRDLVSRIDNEYYHCSSKNLDELDQLKRRVDKMLNKIKRENDFFDKDSMLDKMFSNRHDDDFDEDSMSYDSVFGDD